MTTSRHPLAEYSEETRIDYLSVIAALASVDQSISEAELTQLRLFCEAIGVNEMGIGSVLAVAADPMSLDLSAVTTHFAASDLKFTLLTDLLLMTHADDDVASEEKDLLNQAIARLGISAAQMQAIAGYVTNLRAAQAYKRGHDAEWRRIGSEIGDALKRQGIPLKCVVATDILHNANNRSESAQAFQIGVSNAASACKNGQSKL